MGGDSGGKETINCYGGADVIVEDDIWYLTLHSIRWSCSYIRSLDS